VPQRRRRGAYVTARAPLVQEEAELAEAAEPAGDEEAEVASEEPEEEPKVQPGEEPKVQPGEEPARREPEVEPARRELEEAEAKLEQQCAGFLAGEPTGDLGEQQRLIVELRKVAAVGGKRRRCPEPSEVLPVKLVRMYVVAVHEMTYPEAFALGCNDQKVKSASKTVRKWIEEGPADLNIGDGGLVGSLDDAVAFFCYTPQRLGKVSALFKPPIWGARLFEAVGHRGGDPYAARDARPKRQAAPSGGRNAKKARN
jgi:hypothetical protein